MTTTSKIIVVTDLPRSCFGGRAAGFPPPVDWAKGAAPFILKIAPSDNGRPLSVPA